MNTPPTLPTPTVPPPSTSQPIGGAVRASGWLLVIIGAGLSVAMAASTHYLFATIVSGRLSGRPRWHGDAEFTRTTFELFGAVFLFGLTAIGGGIYQIRMSRRHPLLVALSLLLAGAMVYLAYCVISAPTGTL